MSSRTILEGKLRVTRQILKTDLVNCNLNSILEDGEALIENYGFDLEQLGEGMK